MTFHGCPRPHQPALLDCQSTRLATRPGAPGYDFRTRRMRHHAQRPVLGPPLYRKRNSDGRRAAGLEAAAFFIILGCVICPSHERRDYEKF
jgi:hypothetical protein